MRAQFLRLSCLVALTIALLSVSLCSFAGERAIFANRLGGDVEAVYALVRGHEPKRLAGPVATGEEAVYRQDDLRACSRIVVHLGEDAVIQFFTNSYLNDADRLELRANAIGDTTAAFPLLVWREDGRLYGVAAGLPFRFLQGDMGYGMTGEKFAEWFDPLAFGEELDYHFALDLGGVSWSVPDADEDPVFLAGGDGGEPLLTTVTLETGFTGSTLTEIVEELRGAGIRPGAVEFFGGKTVEFGGENEESAAESGPDADWDKLEELIAGMEPGDFSEVEPVLRLVLEDAELNYEFLFDLAESQARLIIDRK